MKRFFQWGILIGIGFMGMVLVTAIGSFAYETTFGESNVTISLPPYQSTLEQQAAWRYNIRVNIIPAFGNPDNAIRCGFLLTESPPITYELPFIKVQEVFQANTQGDEPDVQVWGFYDPQKEVVYTTIGRQDVLVHEYLHVMVQHNVLKGTHKEFCLSELIARTGEHVFDLEEQVTEMRDHMGLGNHLRSGFRQHFYLENMEERFGVTRGIWWHGISKKKQ